MGEKYIHFRLRNELSTGLPTDLSYYYNIFNIFILCSHFVPNLTFGAPLVKCLRKKVPNAFFGELKNC